jgi:hypothetical protein
MPLLPQQQRSMIPLKNALIAGINLSSKFNAPGQPSGIEIGQPIFGSLLLVSLIVVPPETRHSVGPGLQLARTRTAPPLMSPMYVF